MTQMRFNSPPGWPTPPEGWSPGPDWRPDPAWPSPPLGWQWWVPHGYVGVLPPQRPRGKTLRVLLTLLIIMSPWLMALLGGFVAVLSVDRSDYSSEQAYAQATSDRSDWVTPVVVACMLVMYALLARKVSYRWFDAFCMFIPVYGLLWQFRIAYRTAYLPHRDWKPRPNEAREWPEWLEPWGAAAAPWARNGPSPTSAPPSW